MESRSLIGGRDREFTFEFKAVTGRVGSGTRPFALLVRARPLRAHWRGVAGARCAAMSTGLIRGIQLASGGARMNNEFVRILPRGCSDR